VSAPDIAENGAVVPVGAMSELADTTDMWVLVEKNPNPLAAAFSFPAGTDADVDLRVKMGQTSDVYVVVKAGGQLQYAKKETKVTLGGCGG
jgi:sulfur-oxidizing protein SoxY